MQVWQRFGVALWAALGLLLVAEGAAAETSAAYTVGSGDKLRITVFNEESLSGEFEVDGTGVLSMPLIGHVKARGLGLREIEKQIAAQLADGYIVNPRVSIEVLNFRPFYILGEVNNPGSYPYVDGMKVLNAVALAGGYTYRAREGELKVLRQGDASRQEQPVTEDDPVLPGDIIKVPERFF